MLETLLGMVVLAAAREYVIAARLLGESVPGYHYLWGGVVWAAEEPEWLPGLWSKEAS